MSEPSETPPAPTSPEPTPTFSKEELKAALKAFKKRLKLNRLDDESRLGRSPMTSGGKSGIFAVRAPDQFPQEIWEELVRQGKLKDSGGGLYELVVTS